MWYMHTIELHPTVKKNEVMKFVAKWIQLGGKVTLSEVTQTQKAEC